MQSLFFSSVEKISFTAEFSLLSRLSTPCCFKPVFGISWMILIVSEIILVWIWRITKVSADRKEELWLGACLSEKHKEARVVKAKVREDRKTEMMAVMSLTPYCHRVFQCWLEGMRADTGLCLIWKTVAQSQSESDNISRINCQACQAEPSRCSLKHSVHGFVTVITFFCVNIWQTATLLHVTKTTELEIHY